MEINLLNKVYQEQMEWTKEDLSIKINFYRRHIDVKKCKISLYAPKYLLTVSFVKKLKFIVLKNIIKNKNT